MNYTKWRNCTLNAKVHTDKKYLVLRMGDFLISTAGLGWYIIYTLYGIKFAVENDYIPVVDWRNCKLPRYDAAKVGKENVWEYFFEQPFCVTVEQAYASEDFFVIDDVSKFDYQSYLDVGKFIDFYDKDIMEWREYFQKYIRIKGEVKKLFEQFEKKQAIENEDFVGVLARGTDYATLKPVGHLKPIPTDEIYEQIDLCRNREKIFLATEDEKILKLFEDRYKRDICTVDTKRYQEFGYNILNGVCREDGYKRDLNYLYSIYMISKSQACICSACGGGILVSLMREDEGRYYKYLCHGHNRAKGIIVGSSIEKERDEIVYVGNKPLMFYALNTLKLLCVEEIDIIVSENIKIQYEEKVGLSNYGKIKINYILSDTYDITEYMVNNYNFLDSSKVVLLYSDCIIHGKGVINELFDRIHSLDGAYVWGIESYFSKTLGSIKIDKKWGIPEEISEFYQKGNYSLIGRYIFDYDLKEIIKQLIQERKKFKLTDILSEYIKRKKLFFSEYTRGIICLKLEDLNELEKADQLIRLLEDIQTQKIGDF